MAISQIPIENMFSKHFGGTSRGTLDSARKGYFFTFYLQIPNMLVNVPGVEFKDTMSMSKYLTATTVSIDGFDISVSKNTTQGVGNTKYSEVTGIDFGDSITTAHREFKGLPMSRLFHAWVKLMADYTTGGRHVITGENNQQSGYKCTILQVNTDSDYETIQNAIMYTGCFPDKDPMSGYLNQDITSLDKVPDISITWNIDKFFHSFDFPFVLQEASVWLSTMRESILATRNGDFGGPTL